MVKGWKIVSSRVDRDYRVFRVRVDEAISPRTDALSEFYSLESRDWVNVIALTPDESVVMIRQYRHGSRAVTLEIPGGLVEEADPGQAAARELMEETGYRGEAPVLLGCVNPNPAIFTNACYTYLVRDAVPTGQVCLDDKEDIEVETLPVASIPGLIASGTIDHALVIVAFHFYLNRGPAVP